MKPLRTYRQGIDSIIVLSVDDTRCCEIALDFQNIEIFQLGYMMYLLPILTEIAQYRTYSPTICYDKLISILEGRGWTKW